MGCFWAVLWIAVQVAGTGCCSDSLCELHKSSTLKNEDISGYYSKIKKALKSNDNATADHILYRIDVEDSSQLLLFSMMYRNAEVPLYLMRRKDIIDDFGWVNVFLAVKTMRQLEFPIHLFTIIDAIGSDRLKIEDQNELFMIMGQFQHFIDPSEFVGDYVSSRLELARNRKVHANELPYFIKRSRLFVTKLLLHHYHDSILTPLLDGVSGTAIAELVRLVRTFLFIVAARSASHGGLKILKLDLNDPFLSIVVPIFRHFIEYPPSHI